VKIAKAHARVANQRSDAIHKMTTNVVRTKRPEVIVLEDLSVKNMVKNHKLAGAISDAAFGEIRRQFEYKAQWYGSKIEVADRFFPSTKMCSCCGALKKMELKDRVYDCACCGNVMDRDLNAALNLAKIPTVSSTGCARGVSIGPQNIVAAPVKREPDTKSHCAV
jgi:putative transposase